MNLVPVFATLFVFLFLAALIGCLVPYFRFRHSREKHWATEVLQLVEDAESCVRQENRQLQELKKDRDAKARSLREKAFAALLSEYSVDELEAYPGIGPGTVGKLRAAGFVNLASLNRAQIRIPGLGAKRLADIDYAVRNLLGKARGAFDAGNCRQAGELAEKLEALSTQYDRLETKARTRARAAEEFIARLDESVEYARGVTFWRWLRPIAKEALVPDDIMEASLPGLETALRAAEQRNAASKSAKRSPTPEAIPVVSSSSPRQTAPPIQVQKNAPVSASNSEPKKQTDIHLVIMELTIQFALSVARQDGPITWTERELIRKEMRQRFRHDRALLNRAETLCAHYETAAIDFERCVNEIKREFTAGHRTALMEFAGQIVAVSGNEAGRSAPFLLQLAKSLDVPPLALPQREPNTVPAKPPSSPPVAAQPTLSQKPDAVSASPSPPPARTSPSPAQPAISPTKPAIPTKEECRDLLEIPSGTPLSAALVRRQWNLLSERLAPEKVTSMGADFVKLAQDKLAALRRAAETLLDTMGEKLETKLPPPPVQDLRHNPDLDDVFGGM